MPHKLIKDLDEENWRKFVAVCKMKNVKVGQELNKILDDYLSKQFKRLFGK